MSSLGKEHGAVRIRPLVAAPGTQEPNMSVFSYVRLLHVCDDTVYTEIYPNPLNVTAAQALTELDRNGFYVGNVSMAAAAVLAPNRRPFTAGKPAENIDITHFPFPFHHLNERC